jgi:hypothetical protein
MKKVKIMLAVMVVLTTAGGVLAFRISEAKRGIAICTREMLGSQCPPGRGCLDQEIWRRLGGGIPNICYSSRPPNMPCNQLKCELPIQTLPQQ